VLFLLSTFCFIFLLSLAAGPVVFCKVIGASLVGFGSCLLLLDVLLVLSCVSTAVGWIVFVPLLVTLSGGPLSHGWISLSSTGTLIGNRD